MGQLSSVYVCAFPQPTQTIAHKRYFNALDKYFRFLLSEVSEMHTMNAIDVAVNLIKYV